MLAGYRERVPKMGIRRACGILLIRQGARSRVHDLG